jgi:hypothetical protein
MGQITTCGLLTSRSIASSEHADQFLGLFERLDKGLSVARCGNTEPLPPCDFAKAVADWASLGASGFHWGTRRYGGDGSFFAHSSRQSLDAVCLSFERDGFDVARLLPLLSEVADAFKADFAYVHSTFEEEVGEREYYRVHVMPFTQGLMPPELKKGLPGIVWGMYFGNDYVGALRSKLLQVPAYRVRALESGVLVQATERLTTYADDYPAYRAAREPMAAYLNAEMPELMPRPLSGPA